MEVEEWGKQKAIKFLRKKKTKLDRAKMIKIYCLYLSSNINNNIYSSFLRDCNDTYLHT